MVWLPFALVLTAAPAWGGEAGRSAQIATPRRPTPDYRGRPAGPPSLGERLIWVPRIILYPAHRALESFVRWPLLRLGTAAEQHRVYEWLRHIFVWRDGRAGAIPTFLYEFGLTPSVGLFAFYDDLLITGHRLVFHGGYGGLDWMRIDLQDQIWLPPGGRNRLTLLGQFVRRPDQPFYGIGPETAAGHGTYYREDLLEIRAELARVLGGLDWLKVHINYLRAGFAPGKARSIETRFSVAELPGFAGYGLLGGGVQIELDSRQPSLEASGSGVRVELFGSFHAEPPSWRRRLVRWGGEVAGVLDVSGAGHLLGLSTFVAFLESAGPEAVPFRELISLGGRQRMRGYPIGRFRGESAIAVTASYRYPIWAYLDAEVFLGVGNAFEGHLDGLALQRLFLCWGITVRTSTARDLSFDFLLGFGSNRLDSSRVALDTVNVAIGYHPGF